MQIKSEVTRQITSQMSNKINVLLLKLSPNRHDGFSRARGHYRWPMSGPDGREGTGYQVVKHMSRFNTLYDWIDIRIYRIATLLY